MSVNLTWSTSEGGVGISSAVDHGAIANGAATVEDITIWIRHDGANEITDAALYIRELSGTYSGSATPTADLAELLEWGDDSTEIGFGGFMVSFDGSTWPTYESEETKSPANAFVHRTGVGDSEGNAVAIPIAAGASSEGTIAAGGSVSFGVRVEVPSNEETLGVRQWDQVCVFSYTS